MFPPEQKSESRLPGTQLIFQSGPLLPFFFLEPLLQLISL